MQVPSVSLQLLLLDQEVVVKFISKEVRPIAELLADVAVGL